MQDHAIAHNLLRVNHDPSMGNDNIVFMCRAIGYEHIQVNAIRVIADTRIQEKSESPRSEESSLSGNKKLGNKLSQKLQAKQETLTTGGLQIHKASLPYEVIYIEARDRQMSAVIIYNTGSEFSFCNQDTKSMASNIGKARRNLAISTINDVQGGLMQLCKLKLENGQDIEAIMFPSMELQLQPQNIPNQWQSLDGKWANQNTKGVTAQILLGANQATSFPQAVRDASGALLQVNQARLMKSKITGKYIMFGCSNPSTSTEASNLMKPGKFKSPRFGCKASPTLVSAITRNIRNLQSQGNNQQSKSPIVKENKSNLRKKHGGNPHEIRLSNLRESKERGTTSKRLDASQPLPSANLKSPQSKGNELQQPAALPEMNHNLQDTKSQLSLCLAKGKSNKSQSSISDSIERAEWQLTRLKQPKRKINSIINHKPTSKTLY